MSGPVVVIGAGAAGLTAGALLAREGREVVVLEAADEPGGHLRTRTCGGHRVDASVHFLMACHEVGLVRRILARLEVEAPLLRADTFVTARYPGLSLEVPTGREAFVAAHAGVWPAEVDGLVALLDLCHEVLWEVRRFPVRPGFWGLPGAAWHARTLVRYRHQVLADVLAAHLHDPQLRAVIATLWPYMGLPPSRLSFLLWAVMTASYVDEGAHRCAGGTGSLASALVGALTTHGGTLRLGARAERIVTRGGAVAGVQLADGLTLPACAVVATGDVRQTLGTLIPEPQVPPAVLRRVRTEEVSAAAWAMALAVPSVGDAPLETHLHAGFDHDLAWRRSGTGAPGGVIVTVPTRLDPSLAPDGHQVVVKAVLPPDTHLDPERLTAALLQLGSEVVPGLQGAEVLRPLWGSGPAYGWAASPANCGPGRLSQWVGIEGLVLAGHWTQPGPGVSTSMESGLRAARTVLGSDLGVGVLDAALRP